MPFESKDPKSLTFDAFEDYFGRPLQSLGPVHIGDKLKIYCVEKGDLFVLIFSSIKLPPGSTFSVNVDRKAPYLIGSCMKNITSDGSPDWLWAPLLMDEEFHHESASYFNEPLPECGE